MRVSAASAWDPPFLFGKHDKKRAESKTVDRDPRFIEREGGETINLRRSLAVSYACCIGTYSNGMVAYSHVYIPLPLTVDGVGGVAGPVSYLFYPAASFAQAGRLEAWAHRLWDLSCVVLRGFHPVHLQSFRCNVWAPFREWAALMRHGPSLSEPVPKMWCPL